MGAVLSTHVCRLGVIRTMFPKVPIIALTATATLQAGGRLWARVQVLRPFCTAHALHHGLVVSPKAVHCLSTMIHMHHLVLFRLFFAGEGGCVQDPGH